MNALLHAHASRIELGITFEPRMLRLCVRDDGIGVAPAAAETAERSGHWGLSGMRDRAARVGGTLELCAAPSGGTEVLVSIPVDPAGQSRAG